MKRLKRWIITVAVLAQALASQATAGDGSGKYTDVEKLVAIGDLHGDYKALRKILRSSGIVDLEGNWIGGGAHVVLNGDLIAGKKKSKELIDFVIALEGQAELAGGRVHALLGNHDILVASGDYSHMTGSERAAFIPGAKPEVETDMEAQREPAPERQLELPLESEDARALKEIAALNELFMDKGPYGKWMAKRPMAVMINKKIYVHAGFEAEALNYKIREINELTHAWMKYFQGRGERPPETTEWIVGMRNGAFKGEIGPAFSRVYKINRLQAGLDDMRREGTPSKELVAKILAHFGAEQMVLGHMPTPTGQIMTSHPYYGKMIALIDTKISDEEIGKVSALVTEDGRTESRYFARKDKSLTCRALFE